MTTNPLHLVSFWNFGFDDQKSLQEYFFDAFRSFFIRKMKNLAGLRYGYFGEDSGPFGCGMTTICVYFDAYSFLAENNNKPSRGKLGKSLGFISFMCMLYYISNFIL